MERAFAMSCKFRVPSPELRAEEARNSCLVAGSWWLVAPGRLARAQTWDDAHFEKRGKD
jgi:hypothetical protein